MCKSALSSPMDWILRYIKTYLFTTTQHQKPKPGKGDSKKNQDNIRQEPRHLQGQHWDLLKKTSLQLMHKSSNDIRRGNMGLTTQTKNTLAAAQAKIERSICKT